MGSEQVPVGNVMQPVFGPQTVVKAVGEAQICAEKYRSAEILLSEPAPVQQANIYPQVQRGSCAGSVE